MNDEASVIQWLPQGSSIWVAVMLGFVPALVGGVKRRSMTHWYIYGLVCALVAWPLVMLPTIHALVLRRRNATPEQIGHQRRADALALLAEDSVQSYPSWIAELSRRSPAGVDGRYYAYKHLGAGEALALVRQASSNDRAVAYYHGAVHLGFVPKRHRWIADALDDGVSLTAIVEKVEAGWIFRQRARYVGTRIILLSEPSFAFRKR